MEKKTVLITGGARGIGASIVEYLAKKGNAILFSYYHSEKQAIELQQRLQQKGYCVQGYKADVTDLSQIEKLVDFAKQQYGTIDVLINNAGIDQIKLFTEITKQDWDEMIATNLTSAFFMAQQVAKIMISQKRGAIINISSIWGQIGASCEVHYSISKAGLDGMTKALAKELAPCQIRVNSIAPRNDSYTDERFLNTN